jgi:flagellar hook-associated protein FlgK
MRSSFIGLEVQKRSIQVAQKNLDIVAHNLGNMKTPGYTRQRVDVASLSISSFTYWQTSLSRLSLAGQGVTAFGVSQIRNAYLDKRYRDMVPFAREYDVKHKIMSELETTMDNIDNFGLLAAFDNLKSIMEQVSLSSADAREMNSQIRNQVTNIAAMMRSYHTDLTRLMDNNIIELENSVKETNRIIDKIVTYNKAIVKEYVLDAGRIQRGQGVSEYGPLELLDSRNLLLDQLAEFAEIEVFQNNNGSVRVTMAGVTIIDDQFSENLVLLDYRDYNAAVMTFSNGSDFRPRTGELKAYMDMLNGNGPYAAGSYQSSEFGIPYYLHALNVFAEGFATLMNDVNKGGITEGSQFERNLIWGGYELDHNGNIRQAPRLDASGMPVLDANGIPIMDNVRARIDASNIKVSNEWLENVMMIGETFHAEAIANYRIGGQPHTEGRVFLDPQTGVYYLVEQGTFNATDDMSLANAVASGQVRAISPRPETAPVFARGRAYDLNSVFLCQDTNVYYRVTTAITAAPTGTTGRTVAELRADGDILAVGINQGRWASANLDGSNLLRFVRALEEPRDWGRAWDFSGSAFGYLQFLSDRLSTGIDHMEKMFDMTMDTVNTLLDNRDSISAVSDTEEGINMMKYQKWYNASARLMTTMDEALDTLINRTGRVGL